MSNIGTIIADIAKSRSEIEGARMLVLSAAHRIDQVRAKGAMKDIGIAKVSSQPRLFLAIVVLMSFVPFHSSSSLKWPWVLSTEPCNRLVPKGSVKTKTSPKCTDLSES